MDEEIKPNSADPDQESYDGDLLEEGDEDDNEDSNSLTLDEIEVVAGRKFKSLDDFTKHYINLKSFVGKKEEKKDKTSKEKKEDIVNKDETINTILNEINNLKLQNEENALIADNPYIKTHLQIVKDVSRSRNVSLNEAWEQIKDVINSSEENKKRTIGINSKTRISPVDFKQNKQLIEKAIHGNEYAKDTLVEKQLKSLGLMQ